MRSGRSRLLAALCAVLPLFCACASWKTAARFEGWSLYVQDGRPVSVAEFRAAVEPAFAAVERTLGPFRDTVRVHAWHGGVEMQSGNRGLIRHGDDSALQEIPGVGPARVRAFHARAPTSPFAPSGVFVGAADPGTAVHELVHARLAEERERLPLWFEEGFAALLGDGALFEGEWVVDGLACWPWRELSEVHVTDRHLALLLSIDSSHEHSVPDNVLLHFVGWAVVFDLYRELGVLDWRALLARFRAAPDPVAEARRRMRRTLAPATPLQWLARLDDPDPGRRLAAARGTWKLDSDAVLERVLAALRVERQPEVRVALAVNALAAAGQVRRSWRLRGRLWRWVYPVLRDGELSDPTEAAALRTLYRAYRGRDGHVDTGSALSDLARFWEE